MTDSPWKDGEALADEHWAKASEKIAEEMTKHLDSYQAVSAEIMQTLAKGLDARRVPISGLHRLTVICHVLAHEELITLAETEAHHPNFRPGDMNMDSLRETVNVLLDINRGYVDERVKRSDPRITLMKAVVGKMRRR